jgi:hypothetical protein
MLDRTAPEEHAMRAPVTAAMLALVASCASDVPSPDDLERSYGDALITTQARASELAPQQRDAVLARIADLFHEMSEEKVRRLVPEVYAPDAYLNDGLKQQVGAEAIAEYLSRSVSGAKRIDFAFMDIVDPRSGPEYYVRWQMTQERDGLNGGKPYAAGGVSHFRFDAQGRLILHRDYWNTASGFYERLPGVGWLIRRVRARL